MSRWNLATLLGIAALTLVGLSLSYSAPRDTGNLRQKHENINLLIDVMDEVQKKYVRELDDKQMRTFVEDMVNGGLQRLDPHSGFINQEEFEQFQKHSKGKFGGVGIRVTMDSKTGQVLVESPMVGTPAYKAGVLAGDIITKVDDKSTENMNFKEVIEMIQGDPGDKVKLTLAREGNSEPVNVEITRAIINIDSVLGDRPLQDAEKKWDYYVDEKNKVAYVRITAFTETTVAELTKVVQKLQMEGMQGLIIDLRNNPGGLLRSAVEVSGMFLPPGKTVVTTKGRDGHEDVYHSRTPRGMEESVTNVPIAILLNRYSASASEIVAAALQDHLRAIIVGERSYGKGSVQNVIRLEGGKTALKLTTASYWRPSGKNIHRFPDAKKTDEWGVKPNKGYEVKLTTKELRDYFIYRRERDIIHRPGEKKKESEHKKDASDKELKNFKDKVLDKALEYIRGKIKQKARGNAAVPQLPRVYEARRRESGRPAVPVARSAEIRVGIRQRC